MGANIAALYGGVRPQRARWLVNLEGVGLSPTVADAAPARYARWLDELREPLKDGRYRSVEQFASVLEMRNPRLTPERAAFVARAWTRNTGETELEGAKAGGEVQLLFDPRHRLVNPVLYRAEEARARRQRIEIPILLLTGGVSGHRERVASELNEAQTHSLFRKLQIETLPGLGHMMHHEDPQAVATPIIEFRNGRIDENTAHRRCAFGEEFTGAALGGGKIALGGCAGDRHAERPGDGGAHCHASPRAAGALAGG